jgi:hypothetical protein
LAEQQNERNPEIQRILLQLLAHYITQLAKLEPDESPDDVLLGIKLTCGLLRSGTEHWGSCATTGCGSTTKNRSYYYPFSPQERESPLEAMLYRPEFKRPKLT